MNKYFSSWMLANLVSICLVPLTAAEEMDHSMHHQHGQMGNMQGMDMSDHEMPMDHSKHQMTAPVPRETVYGKPLVAGEPFDHIPMQHMPMQWYVMADRFEQRMHEDDDTALWDVDAWFGSQINRFYLETEGDYNTGEGHVEEAQLELYYNHAISTFWDTQIGIRHDFLKDADDRDYLGFGFQGLAPYWFEVDATVYLSDEGDFSFTLETEYDIQITQRLILQPRMELEMAAQDVPEYSVGGGVNGFELGARLRYEIDRQFAPYIGVEWNRNIGETKHMLEDEGEDTGVLSIMAGIKFWF